ncbi:hypothetical protein CEUSTIGMA_g6271.t1 [Chlamydomonas eustigma]|uniref:SnoaL-like domain-containing protein n=1 Tax=Chlamydomonas eustigma TaxID=1157962 RepID=A0A250X6W6_9CHLO|nr:hypothetical protein CEUSTIGMA_g6271.t1 [Chlamydomonas eustigma]|eukprot:GAX78834.1 hypothetical protein CEUSTIGMA_g6271.t1 [Chlamydomonas eustigma]
MHSMLLKRLVSDTRTSSKIVFTSLRTCHYHLRVEHAYYHRHNLCHQPSRRQDRASTAAATVTDDDAIPALPSIPTNVTQQHQEKSFETVLSFFHRLNSRDISGLLQLLSDDIVHHDLAHENPALNKLEVAKFYQELLASLSENMKFVVEDITDGDSFYVGVTWHIAVEGLELPLGRGVGFYKVSRGKIHYVRQSPEHFLKVANLALSATGMASPLVHALGPAVSPIFWSSMLDTASNVITSAQPAESLHQFLSDSIDNSNLFSFFPWDTMPNSAPPHLRHRPTASPTLSKLSFATVEESVKHSSGTPPCLCSKDTISLHFQGHPKNSMAAVREEQKGSRVVSEASPNIEQQVVVTVPSRKAFNVQHTASAGQLASALAAAAAEEAAISTKIAAVATQSSVCRACAAELGTEPLENNIVPAPRLSTNSSDLAADKALLLTHSEPVNLTGIWTKMPELSELEAYEKVLDLWQISGMQKATAKLIEGLEIRQSGSQFHVHFMTIIPYFKVTEKYDLQQTCNVMRRDLRPGSGAATAKGLESGLGVAIDVKFGSPFPGRLEELYWCPEPGVMHVKSTIFVGDKSLGTTQVCTMHTDHNRTYSCMCYYYD